MDQKEDRGRGVVGGEAVWGAPELTKMGPCARLSGVGGGLELRGGGDCWPFSTEKTADVGGDWAPKFDVLGLELVLPLQPKLTRLRVEVGGDPSDPSRNVTPET